MTLIRDFNDIIETYGHYVLLVRKDRKTLCTCWDPVTGSASTDCSFCFGAGVLSVIERHRVREQDQNVPETLPYLASTQLFGELAVSTRAYFFKMDASPAPGDLILDVDWDGDKPVYTGRGLYEVSHIDKKRFEQGEFVYQKVYVKDTPVEKSIRAIHIVERAGTQLYFVEGALL